MAWSVVHPGGFREPFDKGQSGKTIPAPMVVVKPPAYSRISVTAIVRKQ
jgi:hypothetical protein